MYATCMQVASYIFIWYFYTDVVININLLAIYRPLSVIASRSNLGQTIEKSKIKNLIAMVTSKFTELVAIAR